MTTLTERMSFLDSKWTKSEDLRGTKIYGLNGNQLGKIDYLIIAKDSREIQYAVMRFGGFMGLGYSQYPIPWNKLTHDKSLDGYRANITEQQLKMAGHFESVD